MTKIFFATETDIAQIWRWLFDVPSMTIFEDHSAPDKSNRWFDTWGDVSSYLERGGYALAAWPQNVGGRPTIEKIAFKRDLQMELGGTGRSILRSPATIRIHRNNDQNGCLASTSLSFWSEKGARERSIIPTEFIDDVDWTSFRSITDKIQRQIAKAAPAKMQSYPVMPDAFEQFSANRIRLWGWGEPVTYPSAIVTPR